MEEIALKARGRPRKFDREQALWSALEIFWKRGYEPATTAELCAAMGLAPPSMYAAFGNKANLFLESLKLYEKTFWQEPAADFMAEPDIYKAVEKFFDQAVQILLNPASPCGCMVVLAAVNISETEKEIIQVVTQLREDTQKMFLAKLREAIQTGQIPANTDAPALAGALNTFLEGLSLQCRQGLFQSQLKAIAAHAVKMLPPCQ